ncbi:hypothetical protein MN116_001871 [Schistosoma mekongi]|uniref:YEATS domain-containing protein n=1 Tax=Schistosoma mekongi TaxID=38744 RepID=A0AAE2D887_SCHME|nr:hypothetical protein MN116_001871 [Schistosoma mekongi]
MNCHILFVFKVGHSVQRKPKPINGRTHHWRCYVDSWNPRYPLSAFVKKVTFKLHSTFENPRQVVRQAPFAIEEDGFGTFQLQIEVAFLDCVTTFYYDLTLFDQNALHTYRTIQMDPAPEDWNKLIQLGGIAIPRTSSQSTVHEIVRTIQSYSDLESLHPFSFYPELEPIAKPVNKEKLATYTNQMRTENYPELDICTNSEVLDYSSNYQMLHSESISKASEDQSLLDSDTRHSSLQTSSSSDRLLINQHLPQKHKKKLQLLHEAQLLLEKAQQSRNWAPVISPPLPPIQPPITATINTPEDGHIASPNLSTWSSQLSPSRSGSHDPTDILDHTHPHHLFYMNHKSPVAQFHGQTTIDSHNPKSPKSESAKLSYTAEFSNQESYAPAKQRIVLKLSRSSCGSQLSVSSSQPLEEEHIEKLERKKRKKEAKKERRGKNLGGSPTKHSFASLNKILVSTTTSTANTTTTINTMDKDLLDTTTNRNKLPSQILSSETSSSSCKKHSPRKYSHYNYSNGLSPGLIYNLRKEVNKSPKICCFNDDSNNNMTFEAVNEQNRMNINRYSHQQYSLINNIQQDENDGFASDVDSLCDSFGRSTHSHLLLMDQKNDYHNESERETPVVDYFGDEFQQHGQKGQYSTTPPVIASSSNARNFKYADELSTVNNENPVQSGASDHSDSSSGSSRVYDPEEPLTHSAVATTNSELYEEDFEDFTPSKNCSTYEEPSNKNSNNMLGSKYTNQHDNERNKSSTDESQMSSINQSNKQYNIIEKVESRLLSKPKHKISFNTASNKLSTHTTKRQIGFQKSTASMNEIPTKQLKVPDHSNSLVLDSCKSKTYDNVEIHALDLHNRKKVTTKASKSHDNSFVSSSSFTKPLNIPTVNHDMSYENSSADHNKGRFSSSSRDKEVKYANKSKKNEKGLEQDSSKLFSDHETCNSISVSRTHKYTSKVLNSSEISKQNSDEQILIREQSNREHSSSSSFNKVNNSNNIVSSATTHIDNDFVDAELSSLSSNPSCNSSSSVTPPMLSDETFHLIAVNEVRSDETGNGTVNQLKLNENRRVPTSASVPSARESEYASVHVKNDTNSTSKVIPCGSNNNKSEKSVNLDHQLFSANIEGYNSNLTKFNNHNLEVLFDRLIRLSEPHLALRMSEILLCYISSKSPDSSERKSKSNTNISNSNSSKGVKVIHDNPKLIAFDLRKLPNSCIEKLTALIKEDEEIFRKHNSTIFPSTSNLVNENVWDNRRYVYPEDTDHNSCFHDVDKHREYSDHRDSSESCDS